MTIYEKLLNVQTELKAPKGQYNAFGKYKYRNCEDILEAVKPLLKKHKCTVFLHDDIVLVDSDNVARFYIKATACFVDIESGEQVEATAFAREEETKKGMDGSQVTGASSSYARKYALNGLFAIDDTKDSDTTNLETDVQEDWRKVFIKRCKERGIDSKVVAENYGLNKASTAEDFRKAVEKIEKGEN